MLPCQKRFVFEAVPLTGAKSRAIECQNLMPTGGTLQGAQNRLLRPCQHARPEARQPDRRCETPWGEGYPHLRGEGLRRQARSSCAGEGIGGPGEGCTLACFKLDRLGRSLAHLVKVIEDLDARGVHFMTAEDGLSTKGTTGKLVLNILGSIAQFERNLMLERTRAGLAAAKAKGRIGGRRRKMGPAEVTRARHLLSKGELNADDVASMLKVSRRTLFREMRAARDREVISATC
jgi:hypothetical protein